MATKILKMDGKELDLSNIPKQDLSDVEKDKKKFIISRLKDARDQRNNSYDYFDGMSLLQWLDRGKRLMNATIPPRKNRTDVNVITGTPRQKAKAIVSNIMRMDYNPDVLAFDKNSQEDKVLGYSMANLLVKSDEIESSDLGGSKEEKFNLRVNKLLEQGTIVWREKWTPTTKMKKKIVSGSMDPSEGFKNLKWLARMNTEFRCESQILDLSNVYFGDINQYEVNKQPYIVTRSTMSYKLAESIYGKWANWKYVSPGSLRQEEIEDEYMFRMEDIEDDDEVEVIEYEDIFNCEYQIIINGIMMLPVDFPLPWDWDGYSVGKQALFPFSDDFVYGKSLMAEVRADGELLDEMLRMLTHKTLQSIKPPTTNQTGKQLSSKIYDYGTMWNDIDPDKINKLIDHQGVTSSEYQLFDLLRQVIDTKTINPTFMGSGTYGSETATEIIEKQKQSQIALAGIDLSIKLMEEKRYNLRLRNILSRWTKPVDYTIDDTRKKLKKVFRKVDVDDGVVEFTDEELGKEERIKKAFELKKEAKKQGKDKKYTMIHLPLLNKLKYKYYIKVNPTNRPSDNMNKIMFAEMINQAVTYFPQEINLDYFKKEWALTWQKDPVEVFANNSMQTIEQSLNMRENEKSTSSDVLKGVKQGEGQKMSNKIKSEL